MAAEENQNLHFDSAISSILSGFGVDFELRDHQKEVLEFVWNNAGRDLIVQWPTGAGKSLIFQMIGRFLNKREKFGRKKSVTIVITPLNLIGEDQFTSLCQKNVSVCLLDIEGKIKKAREGESLDEDSSDDEATLEEAEYVYACKTDATPEDVMAGKYEVIIAHPESLTQTTFGKRLLENEKFCDMVRAVVIDEAHCIQDWGKDFRAAFAALSTLRAFFDALFIVMSATLTQESREFLKKHLSLENPQVFRESPDKANMFFAIEKKSSNVDITSCAEGVFRTELDRLKEEGGSYPVTLAYMPMQWMANAQAYAKTPELFGDPRKGKQRYGLMHLKNATNVKEYILEELKKEDPYLRLVFCTSTLGMGYDSPCAVRVIHGRPPSDMVTLVQQTGRAGRCGQPSVSKVYYNLSDISSAMKHVQDEIRDYCKTGDCLREKILAYFGFEKEKDYVCGCFCCSNCKLKTCADENHNLELPIV